jgi:hypothetical protein
MTRYFKALLIVACIATPLFYILSQFMRNYVATMLILFLYSVALSYLIVFRHSKHLLLLLILENLSVWIIYYYITTPSWVLSNGDLFLMNRVSEEIVAKGYYPFNNEYLTSLRPNYVFYPASFMLQAILSIVTSIDVRTFMYVPILMHAIYLLVLVLTLLLLKRTSSEFSPLVVIPILGFVAPQTFYFVYSHVSRALLYLSLYICIVMFFARSTKKGVMAPMIILTLLAISSVLGHSQEPITFSTFFTLFILFTAIVSLLRYKAEKISYCLYFLSISGYLFLSLVLAYNIYVAIFAFQDIASFLERLLTVLLLEASIEGAVQKTSIAQSVLTKEELVFVVVGFIAMMIYVVTLLLSHLIYVLRSKSWYEITLDLAILTYGLIVVLPLMMPGLGADLFWRPLWTLFIALALWPLAISYSNRGRVYYRGQVSMRLILIIVIALFAFSNAILMRLHLVSSDVFTHEALIIDNMAKSSFIRYLQTTESVRIVLLDSPYQPAYEIHRALTCLMPETTVEIVFRVLQPEVRWYVLSYLNGVMKLREYVAKYDNFEEDIRDSYIFASSHDIPLIFTVLTSKNVIFNSRDIIMLS